mmetsp:Transcript_15614/g.54511  ORF Transcript_15614/g.54511 Transcript_15614/m.54511 type:complete len:94 (-) Transcript_15614:10-291(-)
MAGKAEKLTLSEQQRRNDDAKREAQRRRDLSQLAEAPEADDAPSAADAGGVAPAAEQCACGKVLSLSKKYCDKCKSVYYCGTDYQRPDWPSRK